MFFPFKMFYNCSPHKIVFAKQKSNTQHNCSGKRLW